jgi:D-alanyl-D-alanine carboxypeptidase
VADIATMEPITPDAGFRIASNTKTFTAAAILRLAEDGSLGLDDPITDHLPVELVAPLEQDGYHPVDMTIRQLLLHTSGLYDYGSDEAFREAVLADPTTQWTRLDQVRFAMSHGDPHGEPGDVFNYADTGSILLGSILERTTGTGLAAAYRTLLDFDGLGLADTYLESLEPAPRGVADRAHQYFDAFDGDALHPSFDLYGGGGLVSTTHDLAHFYRALLAGDVFHDASTLQTMLDIPATNDETAAGMGIFRIQLAGQECWYHDGFWGTFVATCPDADVTLALSFDQAQPGDDFDSRALLDQLFAIVRLTEP